MERSLVETAIAAADDSGLPGWARTIEFEDRGHRARLRALPSTWPHCEDVIRSHQAPNREKDGGRVN
jgi:hypothetical protein